MQFGTKPAEDMIVPPGGTGARLTGIAAGVMAFLAVMALALGYVVAQVATEWRDGLTGTATVRLSAPAESLQARTEAVLRVLNSTPGIASARALEAGEQQALLAPWLGANVDYSALALPVLFDVQLSGQGPDGAGLQLRLDAEASGAVWDDHQAWRRPVAEFATRLALVAAVVFGLIIGTMVIIVMLAAGSALAVNGRIIEALRLIGAEDRFVARAFVRRFGKRSLAGSLIGMCLAMLAIAGLTRFGQADPMLGPLLPDIGFWFLPFAVPVLTLIVANLATRLAVRRYLRATS